MLEEEEETVPVEKQQEICYDLVVVGTGLVESMLATAATKRGLKVLQVDSNDYYGGDFSSSNLSGLLNILEHTTSSSSNGCDSSNEHLQHRLWSRYPVFHDIYHDKTSTSTSAFLAPSYKLKGIVHPSLLGQNLSRMEDLGEVSAEHVNPVYWSFLQKKQQLFTAAASKDREFAIDCAQKLIVGTGNYINCLVYSGVSRYLEFKSTDALYFFVDKSYSNSNKNHMWKVPCSKNDIFNSKQLTALEKRSLMKFHQFVADWGRTKIGKDVKVLNEKELALGRSLYRPQNKSDNLDQVDATELSSKSFDDILKQFGLSAKLKSLILYGLCLYNGDKNSWSAEDGLTELSLHINSLGKYGETAFLNTLYGISDMAQGFCRMSAVWGASYMLRKRILGLRTSNEQDAIDTLTLVDDENNLIRCKNLVINAAYRPSSICKSVFTSQSISVYYGQIFPDSKCISMIPPNYEYTDKKNNTIQLGNKYSVCITQSDNTSCCAPDNFSIIHISTLIDDEAYSEENRTLEKFDSRAALVKSECNELHINIHKLVEEFSVETPTNIFRSTIVKPIFESTPSGHEHIVYSKGWNDTSMNLEGEVEEARSIFKSLFGFEDLFENTTEDDDDTGNYEEEEIDEYEAVYKFATNLNT